MTVTAFWMMMLIMTITVGLILQKLKTRMFCYKEVKSIYFVNTCITAFCCFYNHGKLTVFRNYMVKKKFLKRTVFLGLTSKVFHLKQFTFKIFFFFLSVSFDENGVKFLKWLAYFL